MKLLLDENLPEQLLSDLAPIFPGSQHVRRVGLAATGNTKIWGHAKDHGFIIVTRDQDFVDMAIEFGAPPHVLWLDLGNPRTEVTRRAILAVASQLPELFERQGLACVHVPAVGVRRSTR